MVRHWNKLSSDMVGALCLENLKAKQPDLDVLSLFTAGELDHMAFRGPFQL